MARIKQSFTMRLLPGEAQAMFVRDIVPDLHKDAGLTLREEHPGSLEFVPGVDLGAQPFNALEAADPDVVGHEEENEEPDVAALSRSNSDVVQSRRGRLRGNAVPVFSQLRRWSAPRLKVHFEAAGAGTLVTLTGSVERDVRDALARFGDPGHWPATAGGPHD